MTDTSTTNPPAPGRILLAAYRLQWRSVLAGSAFGIGWQSAQVLAPLAIAAAVDRGILGHDRGALALWSMVLVGLCAVEMALTALRHRFAIIPAVQVALRMREHLLARVHRAYPSTPPVRAGDLISRSTSDVSVVSGLVDFTPSSVACIVSCLTVTVALTVIDPLLAAAVVVPLLPIGLVFWWWSRTLERAAAAQQRSTARLSTIAESTVSNARALHGMNATANARGTWDAAARAAQADGVRLGNRRAALLPLVESLRIVATVLVLVIGAIRLDAGRISVGELLAAVTYAAYLGPILSQVGLFLAELRTTLASAARIGSAVAPIDEPRAAPTLPAPSAAGRHVSVIGLRTSTTELEQVEFDIEPGTVSALLTDSDRDPTELAEVIAGRRSPDSGRILLDGVDVTGSALNEIVVVERAAYLFSGTIEESVSFGRPDAADAELERAVQWSAAADVVTAAGGFDAALTAGATNLSGGQRQRIALARALVADPNFLVCVDATAPLDSSTAARVVEGLRERARTTLLVTTDPDAAQLADSVVDLRSEVLR